MPAVANAKSTFMMAPSCVDGIAERLRLLLSIPSRTPAPRPIRIGQDAAMADHPHTIDRWDDETGEDLIEQIADGLPIRMKRRSQVSTKLQFPRSSELVRKMKPKA
jgi:hypothetical protein